MNESNLSAARHFDEVCTRFETAWRTGQRPRIAAVRQALKVVPLEAAPILGVLGRRQVTPEPFLDLPHGAGLPQELVCQPQVRRVQVPAEFPFPLAHQPFAVAHGVERRTHLQRVPDGAAHQAEQRDPSIVDRVSGFYAQHPTLVKALGAAAMWEVLRHMANHTRS